MRWETMREEEFPLMIERAHGVCALAVGCMEKHGQHLPVGTDTLHGNRILELASEREEVCVFPELYFGDLQNNRSRPVSEGYPYGYIAFSAELLLQMMRELCDEIGRNGFKRILIYNAHGGNNCFLGNFLRAVRAEKKDYDVFLYNTKLYNPRDILRHINVRGRDAFPAITDADIATLEEFVAKSRFGGHAGFGETAMLMGTYPELTRLDRCEAESGLSRCVSDPLRRVGLEWGASWHSDFPNAYAGHAPLGLTQAISDVCIEMHVEKLVEALKVLKDDAVMNRIVSTGRKPPKKKKEE